MYKTRKVIAFLIALIMIISCVPVSLTEDGKEQITDTVQNTDIVLIPKNEAPETPEVPETPEELSCTLPGAQDVALSEVIAELAITTDQDVEAFMADIDTVSVSNEETIALKETDGDWTLRAVKEGEEPDSVTISMADGTEYNITASSEGTTEIATEDENTVITTVNDLYLPEEAAVTAETLTETKSEEAITAVQELHDVPAEQSGYQVIDIGLENVNEEEYEGFEVAVNLKEDLTGKDFRLYQVQDGEVTDITDSLQLDSQPTENGLESVSAFSFTTESSAQYVLVYTLETTYTTYDGETFKITLNYETEAGIPDGAELKVREILPEEEAYETYLTDSAEKLGVISDAVTYARFFDIEIWADGQKIQPKTPVSVNISLVDAPDPEEAQIAVVHFDKDGPEIVNDVAPTDDGCCFEANSFSVYAVITVPDQPTGVDDLDGRAVRISRNDQYMTATLVTGGGGMPDSLAKTDDIKKAAIWCFEATNQPGEYNLYTIVDGVKQYLIINRRGDLWGNVELRTDSPQPFIVTENNGKYSFYTTSTNTNAQTSYYFGDRPSSGFAGFHEDTPADYSQLILSFIQPTTTAANDYILVTLFEGEYYVILNDGTLVKTQLSDPQTLKIDDPMVWHYTGQNLYHHAKETGFDGINLASDYFYRYINPDESSALIEEDRSSTVGHPEAEATIWKIDSRPYLEQITINYSGNKINSASNPSNFIGIIRGGDGTLRIAGKQSAESAATIYMAQIIDGNLVYDRDNAIHHTVNHIDISVVGRVAVSTPLAYGKYYYKDDNGQVQTLIVTRENPVTIDISQNVDITSDDIKRANISAYTLDPSDPTKHIPSYDAFYITGYSGNNETGESTNQTRIEGVFKVADLPTIDTNDPDQWKDNKPTKAVLDDRLANRIYYTVTTTKTITFDFVYNGKTLYESAEAASAGGENGVAKGNATVKLGQSFDYWDSRNECPGISNRDEWDDGVIHYGWNASTGAGMDFALGTVDKDKTGVLAIEITKYIVDKAGNAITPLENVNNVFHIYRSPAGKTASYNTENGNAVHYSDEVIALDVDQWTEDYSGYDSLYQKVHDKTLTVGEGGVGTVYDYDVAAGMIYIEEDHSEQHLPRELADVNGKNWKYVGTRLETEYVWRDNGIEYRNHVSKTYTDEDAAYRSIPDVLGDYMDVNGISQYNGFLEFYVYNIYDAEPIDISVKKEWKHQNGSNAEAPDGASVTVTLGRFKLAEDTENPVNGTLKINHKVTGTETDQERHYYATYKVKQGNRVVRSGAYNGTDDGTISQTMTGIPQGNYTFEITESLKGYTAATTLNNQNVTSIPITITANGETTVDVITELTVTTFAPLVNVNVTNSTAKSPNYFEHKFTFPSGSKIVVTINRPGSSYRWSDFSASVSGYVTGDIPWPTTGGYSNVDQMLEYTLPTVSKTTTINLNYLHTWGEEAFTIKSVTLAKPETVNGNGTQSQPASANTSSGGRSLQSANSGTSGTRGSIGQTGNNPTSRIPGMKYVEDISWSTAAAPVQVTLANGVWEDVVRDLPATDDHGNAYLYYIRNVDETGMPEGTVSVIAVGPNGEALTSNGQTVLRVSNTIPNEKPKITLKKTDENGVSLPGATFSFTKTVNGTSDMQTVSITSADGAYMTDELEDGSYSISEVTAPNGYKAISGTINFNVDGMAVAVQGTLPDGVIFDGEDYSYTIKNEPITESGKLKITKRWLDFYGNAMSAASANPVTLKLIQYVQNEGPQHAVRVHFQYLQDGSYKTAKSYAAAGTGTATIKWSWKSGAQPNIKILPEEQIITTENWFCNQVTYDGTYLYANTKQLDQDVTIYVRADCNNSNPYNETYAPTFTEVAGSEKGYSPTGGTRTFTLGADNNWSLLFDYQGDSSIKLGDGGTMLPATYNGKPCLYVVAEENVPSGFAVSYSDNNNGLGNGDNAAVTVYNRKTTLDIKLIKVDKTNRDIKLPDAVFEVHKLDSSKPGVSYLNSWTPQTVTTDANGTAWFRNLSEGYYEIKETQAPNENYFVPEGEGAFYIHITTNGVFCIDMDETKYPSSWQKHANDSMLTMNADKSFTVGNEAYGALQITKAVTVDGESVDRDTTGKRNLADGTYNFTITGPKGYQNTDSIVVTNGVAVSNIILNKLIPGEYVITESESENGTVLSARSGGVNSGENGIRITVASHSTENVNIAAFTNNINTTSLEISKTIVSPMISEKTGKQFTFTVKVTKADGNPLTGTFGSYTFNANGETSVTTTGEETITISGLPQGATYTVTETADNDFNLSGSSGTTGTLGASTATASFTNTRKTGNLTISKTVRNHAASTKSFTFTVEVKNADGTVYTGNAWLDAEKTDSKKISFNEDGKPGQYIATVKAGSALTIYGLPTGVTYTVTETADADYPLYSVDGDTTKSVSAGTIGETTSTAAFVNTMEVVSLHVKKYVQSDDGTTVATLTLKEGTTTQIHVYQKDGDEEKKLHEKTITVDTDGTGEVYDEEVTAGTFNHQLLYNIAEDASSVAGELVAADGTVWNYDHSRIDTEWVWRNNTNPKLHIRAGYNKQTQGGLFWGDYEILGEYYSDDYPTGYWYKEVWHNGEEFNRYLDFEIYNIYVPKTYPVYIRKTDAAATDSTTGLSGAKFDLYGPYSQEETEASGFDPKQNAKRINTASIVTTSTNVKIGDLKDGIYYLVETEAPADYQLLEDPIVITVDSRNEATDPAAVVSYSQPYNVLSTDGTGHTYVNNGSENSPYHELTVTNEHLGTLNITKRLEGKDSDAAPSGTHIYTIKVSTTIDGTTWYVTKNSETNQYQLTQTESTLAVQNGEGNGLTITGLPVSSHGTALKYKVEEVNPDSVEISGYTHVNVSGTTFDSVDNIPVGDGTSAGQANLVNVYQLTRLTISKAMNVNVNPPAEPFTFTVEVKNADNTVYTGNAWLDAEKKESINFNSEGKYTASVAAGISVTIYGLPADCTYKITENGKTGFRLVSVNGAPVETTEPEASATGTIDAGNETTFVNQEVISISVDKTWLNSDDTAMDWPTNTTVTVSLMNGDVMVDSCVLTGEDNDHRSHTFTNLPKYASNGAVINYTVEEKDVTFTKDEDYTHTVTGNMASGFHITNKLKPGALKVTKTVTVDGKPIKTEENTGRIKLADGEYSFTITGPTGYSDIKTFTQNITVTNGVAVAPIIRSDLVPGEYIITETKSTNGTTLSERTGGANSDDNGIKIMVDPGSIADTNIGAFTNNINTTSLSISKTVVSPVPEDRNKQFTFNVKITKPNGTFLTGIFGDYTFDENGETTVTTTGTQTVTISGLPIGATYTVTETTTDADFKVTSASADVSGILGESENNAEFTNARITGSLDISKTVKDKESNNGLNGPYSYPIYVTTQIGDKLYYVKQDGTSWALTDIKTVLTVTNNTPLTISNLPVTAGGTPLTYKVEEINIGTVAVPNYTHVFVDGITSEMVDNITITESTPGAAKLINIYERDKGSLSIYKQVTVNGNADPGTTLADGDYTFTVSNTKAVNNTPPICAGPETTKTVVITLEKGVIKTYTIDGGTPLSPVGGKAIIPGLPTGTYIVTEQADASGKTRLTSDNDISIEVKKDNATNIPTAPFTNDIQVGSLKISKIIAIGDKNGQSISNWADLRKYVADGEYTFGVYTKDENDNLIAASRANGTVVDPVTIKIENGEIKTVAEVKNLLPGKYYIQETEKTNTAVTLDDSIYEVEIKTDEHGVITETGGTTTATNVLPFGSLTITKQTKQIVKNTDGSFSYDPLATNAEFPITVTVMLNGKKCYVQNTDGELGVTAPATFLKVSSAEGGSLTINNLPYGNYHVTESVPGDVEVTDYTYTYVENVSKPVASTTVNTTSGNASLVNIYVQHGEWSPEATKLLNGVGYHGSKFSFRISEITESGTSEIETINKADYGTVYFNEIKYSSEGPHCYLIEEVPDENNNNIEYDNAKFYIKVEVVKEYDPENPGAFVWKTTHHYYSDSSFSTEKEVAKPIFRNYEKGSLIVTKAVKERISEGNYQDLSASDKIYQVTVSVKRNNAIKYVQDKEGNLGDTAPATPLTVSTEEPLVISNLRYGEYTVSEIEPDSDGITNYHYIVGDDASNTQDTAVLGDPGESATTAATATVGLVNVYGRDTGKISIEKTVTVNGETITGGTNWVDGEYSFTVTSNSGTEPATTKNLTVTLKDGAITIVTGGVLENGKAVVKGLPTGTYTVIENLTDEQKAKSIRFSVTGQDNVNVQVITNATTGDESVNASVSTDQTTNIHFVNNIQTGSLKIAKAINIGNTDVASVTDERKNLADGIYTFNVFTNNTATLRAHKVDGNIVDPVQIGIHNGRMVKVENGAIAHDNNEVIYIDSVEVTNLLPGTYYVRETAGDNDAVHQDHTIYPVTVHGKTSGQAIPIATATNELPLGSLKVTKRIQSTKSGDTLTVKPSYPITVTATLNGTTYYVQDTEGRLGTEAPTTSLAVTAGEELQINNLPYGRYTVTEIDPPTTITEGNQTYTYVIENGVSVPSGADNVDIHMGQVNLVNVYTRDTVWTPQAFKKLNEKAHTGQQFSYTITGMTVGANNNSHTETVQASSSGIVQFSSITYTVNDDGKTFKYKIAETQGSDGTILYDTTPIYAKVQPYKVNGAMYVTYAYYSDEDCTMEWDNPTIWNYTLGELTVTKTIQSTSGETIDQTPTYPIEISVPLHGITYYVQNTSGALGKDKPVNSLAVTKGTTLRIPNVPYGEYTVTETNPEDVTVTNYGYVTVDGTSKPSVTTTVNSTPGAAELVNVYERDKGSLSIAKTVTVNSRTVNGTKFIDGTYSFTVSSTGVVPATTKHVTITLNEGKIVSAVNADNITATDVKTITTDGETKAVISGLPTGTYIVTENLSPEQTDKGITFTASDNASSVSVTKNSNTTVPIVSFVNNIKVGSLKISKIAKIGSTMANALNDERKNLADGTYTFKVYKAYTSETDNTPATRSDGTEVENATVEIRNGAVVNDAEIANLLPGKYYVKEISMQPVNGDNRVISLDDQVYEVVVEGEKVGNDVETTAIATVTNTVPLGSLKVKKTIQSTSLEDMNVAPVYPIIVSVRLNKETYYVQNENGELGTTAPTPSLTVTAGTDLTINGLPYGDYTVTESNPGGVIITDYSYVNVDSTSKSSDTVSVGSVAGEVNLVNVYVRGAVWTPQITKQLNGANYTGPDFSFTITGPDNYSKTVSGATNGTVSFPAISYALNDAGKTFDYVIREVSGSGENIAYDTTSVYARVVVTKDDNEIIKAVGTYYKDRNYSEPWDTPTLNNTDLGNLKITKTVTGSYIAGSNEAYPIAIQNGGKYVTVRKDNTATETKYTFNGLSDTDPQYTIKAGEPLNIIGLPVGYYTVTEGEVTKTGYVITTTYKVDDTATAPAVAQVKKGETSDVAIENNYRHAELVITKTISGVDAATAAGKITIKVVDNQGNTLLNQLLNQAPFTLSGSQYTATLKNTDNAEYAKFIVPDGIYTVMETVVEPDHYSLTGSTYAVTAKESVTETDAVSGTGYTFQLTDEDTSRGEIDYTNEYSQPEKPQKQETAPYKGNGVLGAVQVGDVITYEISYRNYKIQAADIIIKDTLDKNVEFVSADTKAKDAGGKVTHTNSTNEDGQTVVTWKVEKVAPGATGKVVLQVKVLERALVSNGGPGNVINDGNKATVKVGGDSEYTLDTVENPVPEEPHKKETMPYQGNGTLGGVKVGDIITYEISYRNYQTEPTDITIKDTLDRHVEFAEASTDPEEAGGTVTYKRSRNEKGEEVVTWTVKTVAPGAFGKVTLKVKVLEGALVSNGGPGKVDNGGDDATVKVGNNKEFTLEKAENPVPENPHKKETAPYEGNGMLGGVHVGDEITYQISFRNYMTQAADVVIKDKLDKNVEFVTASNGGKAENGIVTWTLKNIPAGKEDSVTLTVKVLEGALVSKDGPGKVVNDGSAATVKVGNDREFTLETVENPVPEEPSKKENAPYEGNGVLGSVNVNDLITYEISYRNYKTQAADVVIKDKLDKNVEFVSASNGGKAENGVVTWTLKDIPAGKEDSVVLTVKVLEGALTSKGGPGKVVNNGKTATVKVGNDREFTLNTVENPVSAVTTPPTPTTPKTNQPTTSQTQTTEQKEETKEKTVSVTVSKIWDDNNNSAGLRPATLRVTLSNGQSFTLSQRNGWSITIDNLPAEKNGVPITYTWTEQSVFGYVSDGGVRTGETTVFTNTYRSVVLPPPPGKKRGGSGIPPTFLDDYETPLGVEVSINHVGDCYE